MNAPPKDCGATAHGDAACKASGCEVGSDVSTDERLTAISPAKMAESGNVVMGVPAAAPEGLQLIIHAGEMLPFKRIWFEVEKVGKDYLVLVPKTTTSAYQKKKAREQKD